LFDGVLIFEHQGGQLLAVDSYRYLFVALGKNESFVMASELNAGAVSPVELTYCMCAKRVQNLAFTPDDVGFGELNIQSQMLT
jgi:hypothetical protein